MKSVDFGKTASDYGKHRAGFPQEFFWELVRHGIGTPGQRIVDLGTGTGTIARQLALSGCKVTGIDVSESMLAQAKRLDGEAGACVHYFTGEAENTGLEGQSYDVVTAGQCWHWFDKSRAAAEAFRILRAGGRLVIAHFDWLPLAGSVVEATEQLILKHSPQWQLSGGVGIHSRFMPGLSETGFRDIRTFSFDTDALYSHEAWLGRVRASAGIGPVLSESKVREFDNEHRFVLASRFPGEPLRAPHRVWAVIAHRP
ncbi:MAG: class I SAM-dependent methyltransferase [Burkholderiales bacterium]